MTFLKLVFFFILFCAGKRHAKKDKIRGKGGPDAEIDFRDTELMVSR
jgi:hypothetical protein